MTTPSDSTWLDALCERQRLDLIGDLMGGLAHELNNALSVVSGYQDLLVEALESDSDSRQELQARAQTMHTWTATALAVARRLYDASRQMREPDGPSDVCQVVTEGVELCRYRCERERILLVADLDAQTGHVDVPPGLLLQAVINLVQNARESVSRAAAAQEHGDDGGTIRVATEVEGDVLHLVVEDDGPGVDAADAERIFEVGVSAKTGSGWGYGLPVSRRIVERCGGRLRVEPGVGGRFILEMPRRP